MLVTPLRSYRRGIWTLSRQAVDRRSNTSVNFLRRKHDGSFHESGSNIETNEIKSENNPWSPTLYDDIVYVREPGSLRSKALPSNYRLSYLPLYEAPGAKYVALVKRLTLSMAVLGTYGAKLFYESLQFDDIYAAVTLVSCAAPAVYAQLKTRDYVTRIFRLYDKNKPQTLENLLEDEKLIMEKLSFTGGKTYNELLTITGNKSLQTVLHGSLDILAPYASWQESQNYPGKKRMFYVANDIGGIKMDRLWGIVEHNSGIDTGRYIEPQISASSEKTQQ